MRVRTGSYGVVGDLQKQLPELADRLSRPLLWPVCAVSEFVGVECSHLRRDDERQKMRGLKLFKLSSYQFDSVLQRLYSKRTWYC